MSDCAAGMLGSACNRFDEVDVCVYCTLTAGIIRVAPDDNFTDLMQDAVCFIKVPTFLLTTLVRKRSNRSTAFLQASKVGVRELTLMTAKIPLNALDEDLYDLVSGVGDEW